MKIVSKELFYIIQLIFQLNIHFKMKFSKRLLRYKQKDSGCVYDIGCNHISKAVALCLGLIHKNGLQNKILSFDKMYKYRFWDKAIAIYCLAEQLFSSLGNPG